jgi:hypothetical protein
VATTFRNLLPKWILSPSRSSTSATAPEAVEIADMQGGALAVDAGRDRVCASCKAFSFPVPERAIGIEVRFTRSPLRTKCLHRASMLTSDVICVQMRVDYIAQAELQILDQLEVPVV